MTFLKNDPILKERRRLLRRKQTDAERAFWRNVRNGQFHGLKFFRQYSLGSYILDFYCPEQKLAVELDGDQHNQPENIAYDAERTAFLLGHGISVVRFWNHEVLQEMDAVLMRLEQFITPPVLPPSASLKAGLS